ncbi:MAG: bifunctional aspartate kinase/homoserine dehydrogenase I [Thermoanaerobaculia bacterium]|nr:bifunctional aspartate kinase/homoserine dehydrogenase I [Thermoanaerobaculia bacterium]
MKVLKFGGTSVADADAIGRVVEIVQRAGEESALTVVVSALGGVTNELLTTAELAASRGAWEPRFEALRQRHLLTARDLGLDQGLLDGVEQLCGRLHELLSGVHLLRELSPRARDSILSYGERLSARFVAAALTGAGVLARPLDARDLVVTDDAFGRAAVQIEETYANLRRELGGSESVAVIPGFLGATPDGQTTTLGRGGSDYTAALVGAALASPAIELWTDVDGVYSADPRRVADAFPQRSLSYAELMEMSHFGAKVVHPPSIHPARAAGIPLWIRNTFRPAAEGTLVEAEAKPSEAPIRGLSSIRQVALANLEGDGMVGVPGIAQRLFGALARSKVSVILISQSSSEHSICFAVAPEDAAAAQRAVDEEFELERRLGLVDPLQVETGHSVLAAVGEEMARRPGIAGRIFGVLGRHGVNVRAIAQGSSELNVSLVVEARDEARAVAAIHGAFFHPERRRVDVIVAGVGRVGAALLQQLAEANDGAGGETDLELRLVAVASSRRLRWDSDGLDPATAADDLSGPASEVLDPAELIRRLRRPTGARRVFVDATASDDVGAWYKPLLASGVAVVAANKKPFAERHRGFVDLRLAARSGEVPLCFETTVGAGLPVLSTLRSLIETGDRLMRIDAVLSGTLNAVLDLMSAEVPFSAAVRSAYDEGLTEPKPYDDLCGADVLRKLVILARVAGRELEPEDVQVEPLLGASWAALELEDFWHRLPETDEAFESRRAAAAASGKRLRYVASITADRLAVGLEDVDASHPAFSLSGPDNLVAFTTERYDRTPLVIRGPGAGPQVTASGVFAEILSCID